MPTRKPGSDDSSRWTRRSTVDLRQRAEIKAATMDSLVPVSISTEGAERLLQELRVHQIELEMQNEELRRTEEAIQASRARYLDLYDHAPVGYLTLNGQGVILKANARAAGMLGASSNELVQQPITRFILGEDQDILYLHRKRVFETGQTQVCELRMKRQNGDRFWARMEAILIGVKESGARVSYTVISDITERKRTEALLQKQASLIDMAHDAILIRDAEGRISTWNQGAQRLYGWTSDQAVGQVAHELLKTRFPSPLEKFLADLWKTGSWSGELEQTRRDGSPIVVATRWIVDPDEQGEGRSILEISTDITERKRAEDQFRRLQARLIDLASDAIMVREPSGEITSWNKGAEQLYGWTRDQALGSALRELLKTRFPRPLPEIEAEFARDGLWAGELVQSGRDGSVIVVASRWVRDPDQPRSHGAVLQIDTDITPRKHVEKILARHTEELARSNRELEQFAYIASHDLREPLRAMSNFANLLASRYGGQLDEQADEYIEFVLQGSARMERLIHDLLAYSRVGADRKPLEPTDVSAVLSQALKNLAKAASESQAVVTQDPMPTVPADASLLVQLFQNLIGNAIKFRKDGPPRVHISAERQEKDWTFSVRDNGIGVEPENAEQIFTIFRRLHTQDQYPGSGVGLAICKKIVEQHRGRIWVESAPGAGSTFFVTIPAVAET
jgi:PAS domain S-box-containing protein